MDSEIGNVTDLEEQRKLKIKEIRSKGGNPFPHSYKKDSSSIDIIRKYKDLTGHDTSQEKHSLAGRVITVRIMGKASFFHLQDRDGKIQVYVKNDVVGEELYEFFKRMIDVGDIVGVKGIVFKTRTGEITLKAEDVKLLSKSIKPLPEKWHGLKDIETRYRRRYVDLIVNEDVRKIFRIRSLLISTVRQFLASRGFQEVETPILQSIPGGAAARPFKTFHNTLDMELFLRVAPELYLKRLIVGGLEKVFEIGRCFRNEGIDARHNPEFTMLEVYQAYVDYHGMMELCENLVIHCVEKVTGGHTLHYRGMDINCSKPFKKIDLNERIKDVTGFPIRTLFNNGRLRETARKMSISFEHDTPEHKIFERICDEKIFPAFIEPTFIVGYPRALSPLAKSRDDDPDIVERFELFIGREEIGNAYSELNDPEEQKNRFIDQQKKRDKGDLDASMMDNDFLEALEHGMPPTGGLGIGIDRLTMLVTGAQSIREVLFFPLLREKINSKHEILNSKQTQNLKPKT